MSEWISWSACSVSCGMGMRSRERYVKQYPEDGSLCQLNTEETEKCVVNDECCESFFLLGCVSLCMCVYVTRLKSDFRINQLFQISQSMIIFFIMHLDHQFL